MAGQCATAVFRSVAEYQGAVGRSYGPTDWLIIDQARINAFADATGDHQWIHVDSERAAKGPFGATIAHGFLTLSLVSYFLPQLLTAEGMKLDLNYGCDRVRFPGAVRSGSRVHARAQIVSVEEVGGGAVQVKIRVTIEAEGIEKPVCVADTLSRLYF
ncbi:MAG TPA: MaoC family dehydratase [Steroidobacteraceae bacterium]|jgi:acyl dehydratase|nr:MaoC family dehydratase [Steroidobacteraceae bacterium]